MYITMTDIHTATDSDENNTEFKGAHTMFKEANEER